MKYDYLVFDLDGTISNPEEGIVRSINYSLKEHGFAQRSASELSPFIGPPLDSTFSILTDTEDPVLIKSLVGKYRERYSDVGYAENYLYDGIPELLSQLSCVDGLTLGVCTSKRSDFAKKILHLFSLGYYFSFVDGGDVGIEKWQQLSSLKSSGVINRNSLMIGDRSVDIVAAQKNSMYSAGVLWGFGTHAELSSVNPNFIWSNPEEIMSSIKVYEFLKRDM